MPVGTAELYGAVAWCAAHTPAASHRAAPLLGWNRQSHIRLPPTAAGGIMAAAAEAEAWGCPWRFDVKQVFVAQHPTEAYLVQGLLEANGIVAEVHGESLFSARGEAEGEQPGIQMEPSRRVAPDGRRCDHERPLVTAGVAQCSGLAAFVGSRPQRTR